MTPDLPNNIEAERSILGCIFERMDGIVEVMNILEPGDFYREIYGQIYGATVSLWNRGIRPDHKLIIEQLAARGISAGTVAPVLAELLSSAVVVENTTHYADLVANTADLRNLITASTQIAKLGYDTSRPISKIQAEALAIISNAVRARGGHDLVPLSAILDDYYMEVANSDTSETKAIPTGFRDLDEMTGGLHRSDLIILAARPSVGKTSMALSLTSSICESYERVHRRECDPPLQADDYPFAIHVFSLEMSREQLRNRMLSMETGIDLSSIRDNRLSPPQLTRVFDASGRIYSRPIHIDDTPGLRLEAMRNKLLRAALRRPIGAVFVDYLQLMEADGENRVQEISKISRGLKALARELDAPVIALSQLSRAVEGRTSHVPMLSDLRDSGSIEQDADIVMFLYREELYARETDKKGIAEIHIAKHRNGPIGVVPMRFDAKTTRFDTLSYRIPDGY